MLELEGNLRPKSFHGRNSTSFANRPIAVHSPKIRLRLENALKNAEKSRQSIVKDNFDYRRENAYSEPQPVLGYSDGRGREIANQNKQTVMDKILNPSKEPNYTEERQQPRCAGNINSLANMQRSHNGVMSIGGPRIGSYAYETVSLRCPSSSAQENQARSQQGTGIMQSIQHTADYREPPPNPRVKSDFAQDNRDRSLNSDLFSPPKSNYNPQQPAIRCPSEVSKSIYEKSQGCIAQLFQGKLESSQNPPNPCMRPEGRPNQEKEGVEVKNIFGGNSTNSEQMTAIARVKPEAMKYSEQGRGTMTQTQYNYGHFNLETPPAPRVRPEAKEIASQSQGTMTKNLFERYGKLPGDERPRANVKPGGRKIFRMSQGGAMKDCFNPPRMPHSKNKRK